MILLPATLIFVVPVTALIGYDCAGQELNITTLSLTDIGKCNFDSLEPETREIYLQLMQSSDYDRISVIQCLVEIDRTIYYCGMHSHVSIVRGGRRQYIQEIGLDTCHKLHATGTITVVTALLTGIQPNQTTTRSAMLAGSVTNDGKCSGTQYSDSYGAWDNVAVQASIKITIRTVEASVKRSTNELLLPSGVRHPINNRHGLDHDGSETFWTSLSTDTCHFDQYDILYEGLASKITSKSDVQTPTVYTVTTGETTFALTEVAKLNLCGYQLIQTEHPRLFVLETQPGRVFKTRTKVAIDNLDIFSYVNSKFVYVEKHLKTQLNQLYKDIMEQKCALERQILQNALSLSSIAPDEMAYRIMKSPGYTAVTAGEVIHLIKCIPVDCVIRHVETCYNELPVTVHNASLFLLPRSRILTKNGTPRDCNELLPPMFSVQGTWFRISPRPIESLAPPVIQPLTKPAWKYISPSTLATSGIYTAEDLDRLRSHIMFPVEKPAMINIIARGAMGHQIPEGSISITNLMDENTLNKIAATTGERIWGGFITFGSASAGVLGVFIIVRVIKLIVDTLIHGYALHSVYGWSIHLLGAVWSSVTSLLLHLGRAAMTNSNAPKPDEENPPTSPPPGPSNSDRPVQIVSPYHPEEDPAKCEVQNQTDYVELHKYLDKNYRSLVP